MKHNVALKDVFGFIKPLVDVHTMGNNMVNLLKDCCYKVLVEGFMPVLYLMNQEKKFLKASM